MKPDIIIALGGTLIVLGTITGIFGTYRKSDATKKASDEQKSEIATLKAQNENLRDAVKGYATGGDSYLNFLIITLDDDHYRFDAVLQGQYPLSAVEMWYIDMNGWNKMSNAEAGKYQQEWKRKTYTMLGNFNPGSPSREVGIFQFNKEKGVQEWQFHIFTSNNSTSLVTIKAKWIDSQWLIGTEIIKGDNTPPSYNFNYKVRPSSTNEQLIKEFFSK